MERRNQIKEISQITEVQSNYQEMTNRAIYRKITMKDASAEVVRVQSRKKNLYYLI